jgi:Ni,Fe-hydrogenase I cytochrome b subunit
MRQVTFATAFLLTVCLILAGVVLYPDVLGKAATQNNEIVFGLFLGPFCVFLFLGWLCEKVVLKVSKKTVHRLIEEG